MNFNKIVEVLSSEFGFEFENNDNSTLFNLDDMVVVLTGTEDHFIITADLGVCPGGQSSKLLQNILKANYFFQETKGCSFSTDENGHIILERYDWLDRLTPNIVLTSVDRFSQVALKWHDIIVSYDPQNEETSGTGSVEPKSYDDLMLDLLSMQNLNNMV